MFSFTTIVFSLSLLASQTIAAPNASGPSKHARWVQTPRTLLDPDYLKRDNLEARANVVGFSPLEKKNIFERQTSSCNPGEVECQGNKCCPSGFNCYYVGSTAACCAVGQTCSGLPVGCADPNSLECPTSIGGCCPIGQMCYRDSAGVARCDNAGLFSSSSNAPTPPVISDPPITTPTPTTPTTPVFTPTTPIFTPTTPTTTATTKSANIAGGPETVTVRNGAEKMMASGVGALAVVVMGALVVLA